MSDDFGFTSDDDVALFEAEKVVSQTPSHPKRSREDAGIDHGSPPAKKQSRNFCPEPSEETRQLALKVLHEHFGFKAFRLEQAAAIARLLEGGSATVIFPTGGGKSLCYQIPALAFGELDKKSGERAPGDGGITVVVSPLIALMKDQVDALVRRRVKAAVMDSTRTRDQFLQINQDLRNGSLKLLYCAPERLNNEGFVESLKSVRGGVRLLAIDEAHCVSEWGHSFRPEYLKVARFATEIKAERVICLTATATPKVAKDICSSFGIDHSAGLFRTAMYRPNLRLLAKSSLDKADHYPQLFSFLREHPGPTVIYVTIQKQTEMLAKDLREEGFKAQHFHAGMLTELKMKVQDEFMDSDNMIIVATIAFGMGIDKSNIRNIIHFNIPQSVEEYSQQIGRAGRDGKHSICLFLLSPNDFYLRNIFTYGDLPSKASVRNFLKEVFSPEHAKLAIGATFAATHGTQCRDFDIKTSPLSVMYAQLELQFGYIRATTPMYTNYQYEVTDWGRYISDTSATGKAIRSCARKATKLFTVDVEAASKKPGIMRTDIVARLNKWNENGVVVMRASGVQNIYLVQRKLPSTSPQIDGIADRLYSEMVERECQAIQRTKEVVGLVTGKKCFSRALAAYFDDDAKRLPEECGHCTWCETHQQVLLPNTEPEKPDPALMDKISKICPRDDPLFLARVAFGITSPRVTQLKLKTNPVFGSMPVCDFKELVRAFSEKCADRIATY